MTIKEILRDAPAGQLARTYLGWTISPYEDEKENYQLQQAEKQDSDPRAENPDPENGSDGDFPYDKENDKDLEINAAGTETQGQRRHSTHSGERDIERIQTEKEKHGREQPNAQEVRFSSMDRDNPHNWSTGKKAFVFFQICLLTFSGQSIPTIVISHD